jgi:hypothetical protein
VTDGPPVRVIALVTGDVRVNYALELAGEVVLTFTAVDRASGFERELDVSVVMPYDTALELLGRLFNELES